MCSHNPLPTQGLWQDPDSRDIFRGCPNPEEPPTKLLLTGTNLSVLLKSSNYMQGANNHRINQTAAPPLCSGYCLLTATVNSAGVTPNLDC